MGGKPVQANKHNSNKSVFQMFESEGRCFSYGPHRVSYSMVKRLGSIGISPVGTEKLSFLELLQ